MGLVLVMSECVWHEDGETCDRTDIVARYLCTKHYYKTRNNSRLQTEYLPMGTLDTPGTCGCEKPIIEQFWCGRQCARCGRPFIEDILEDRRNLAEVRGRRHQP